MSEVIVVFTDTKMALPTFILIFDVNVIFIQHTEIKKVNFVTMDTLIHLIFAQLQISHIFFSRTPILRTFKSYNFTQPFVRAESLREIKCAQKFSELKGK